MKMKYHEAGNPGEQCRRNMIGGDEILKIRRKKKSLTNEFDVPKIVTKRIFTIVSHILYEGTFDPRGHNDVIQGSRYLNVVIMPQVSICKMLLSVCV